MNPPKTYYGDSRLNNSCAFAEIMPRRKIMFRPDVSLTNHIHKECLLSRVATNAIMLFQLMRNMYPVLLTV